MAVKVNRSRSRWLAPGLALGAFLCLCLAVAVLAAIFIFRDRPANADADTPGVEYVLDVSERMAQPATNSQSSRLDVARGVLAETLRPVGETVAGLRVFGSGVVATACEDTDLVVPLELAGGPRIAGELERLQPGPANAPLAEAMIAAIADLAEHPGPKSLVVVTGGQDSCQAEAGQLVAAEAARAGVELETFIIGFQVGSAEAEAIKEMVAVVGRSHYLEAADESELEQMVKRVQRYVEAPGEETLAQVATVEANAGPGATTLTRGGSFVYGPKLALDDEEGLHFVWWEDDARQGGDVYYRYRSPSGAWTPAQSITAAIEASIDRYTLELTYRVNGEVCAYFIILEELEYARRCRANGSWGPVETIAPASGIRREFQVAYTPDNRTHVIYLSGAASIYSGEQLISGEEAATDARLVADSQGRLHAIWININDSPYSISHVWSDDRGATWTTPEAINGDTPAERPTALVADTAGNVHLAAWSEATLYYQVWTPDGGWGEPTLLETTVRPMCDRIALVVDAEGAPHLAWQDAVEIVYFRQEGNGWVQTSAPSGGNCLFNRSPALAVASDGLAHFIWSRDLLEGNGALYYTAMPPNSLSSP
jgi:hypothetical protein